VGTDTGEGNVGLCEGGKLLGGADARLMGSDVGSLVGPLVGSLVDCPVVGVEVTSGQQPKH
jgi:hypothetical protein